MNKYYVAVPPYYQGTSFLEIVEGIKSAAKKSNKNIKFIGNLKPLANNFNTELLDDSRYIDGQIYLLKIIKELKNPQKILFIDFFNPGLDLIHYHHEQLGINCKYGSLLHGGTFFEKDLYSFSWLKGFEFAWADTYDTIYAPSYFSKKSLPKNISKKIKVYPWGMDNFKPIDQCKKIDVIFPHRINSDKGIDDLIYIVKKLPNINFTITIPQNINVFKKNKYYQLIATQKNIKILDNNINKKHSKTIGQSKILLSCSKQENFGYSVMKGIISNCIPVLPNSLCYPEFFNKKYLYSSKNECAEKIKYYLKNYDKEINDNILATNRSNIKKLSFKKIIDDFFNA